MAALHTPWTGLVLLGVLGILQIQAQFFPQPNFLEDKFLGRWFTSGLASNKNWLRENKENLYMSKSVVAPMADGGLNITNTFLRKNQCDTQNQLLRPAGPPGHYSYMSPHFGSTRTAWVVDTDYEDYALLYTSGQDINMAFLYSRTQTPSAEMKEKFTTFAEAQGFTEDTIVFLPQTDKCLE